MKEPCIFCRESEQYAENVTRTLKAVLEERERYLENLTAVQASSTRLREQMRAMLTLRELSRRAHAMAVEKGWYQDGVRGVPELLALVHSEVSEALEAYRVRGLESWKDEKGKPEGIASELADVVIRIADMCDALRIDLEKAVTEKMAFNATRPFRHGNKLA